MRFDFRFLSKPRACILIQPRACDDRQQISNIEIRDDYKIITLKNKNQSIVLIAANRLLQTGGSNQFKFAILFFWTPPPASAIADQLPFPYQEDIIVDSAMNEYISRPVYNIILILSNCAVLVTNSRA